MPWYSWSYTLKQLADVAYMFYIYDRVHKIRTVNSIVVNACMLGIMDIGEYRIKKVDKI